MSAFQFMGSREVRDLTGVKETLVIPALLRDELSRCAESLGITRSSLLKVLLYEFLDQQYADLVTPDRVDEISDRARSVRMRDIITREVLPKQGGFASAQWIPGNGKSDPMADRVA